MAIYYVRPDGNNTNTGTGYLASQAWATISKASSVMVAGDTCYIAPAVYRESVNPTVNGSVGNLISFIGDRKCQYFLDKTIGDVIISGMNTESDTNITRSTGFNSSALYLNIANIDVENVGSGGAFTAGANTTITNCNAIKGIALGISIGGSGTVINCKIISNIYSPLAINGNGNVKNCFVKTNGSYDVFTGGANIVIENCVIDGQLASASYGSISLSGCIWSAGMSGCIWVSTSGSLSITARGCMFIGRGNYIIKAVNSTSSPWTFQGCIFKDSFHAVDYSYASGTIFGVFSYNEFDNCQNAIYTTSGNTHVINNCYFKNCWLALTAGAGGINSTSSRFYGVNTIASGTVTNTTPIYGETDVVAGIVASAVSPISGTKSLKIAGYDYASPYLMWIPCEAGKPKTVKIKVKQNSATAGTYIRLGDQTVSPTNNTTLQTLSITYTHHKAELVPLWICPRVNSSGGDFVQFDDVA